MSIAPAQAQDKFRLGDDDQWKKQQSADPESPAGQLQTARRELAAGELNDAADRTDDWIERYPNHPLLVEAHLLRGDIHVAERDYFKSLYEYEKVIRGYPASEQFHTALEREFEVARLFAAGMKRRLWGMRVLPAGEEAEEIFIRIQERSPGSQIGEKASIALGDYYFNEGEMDTALEAYNLFLLNYPRSNFRERALLRLIQASLATFKGPRFDSTGLIEAAQRLRQFQQEFPASAERVGAEALLVRIEESLALKTYFAAQWYQQRNERVSAVYMYHRVVKDYPDTGAAREAIRRLRELGTPIDGPTAADDAKAGDISPDAAKSDTDKNGTDSATQDKSDATEDSGGQP